MTASLLDIVITGEGAYSYDESSGTASFVDSFEASDTLVFARGEDGQIILSFTMIKSGFGVTETITMSGAKG